jgi:hypothetical protein
MEQNGHIIPEDRARITEIQDLLIERYVEQREALAEGNRCRAPVGRGSGPQGMGSSQGGLPTFYRCA